MSADFQLLGRKDLLTHFDWKWQLLNTICHSVDAIKWDSWHFHEHHMRNKIVLKISNIIDDALIFSQPFFFWVGSVRFGLVECSLWMEWLFSFAVLLWHIYACIVVCVWARVHFQYYNEMSCSYYRLTISWFYEQHGWNTKNCEC